MYRVCYVTVDDHRYFEDVEAVNAEDAKRIVKERYEDVKYVVLVSHL